MAEPEIIILGAGICGVLAAQQCVEKGFSFKIFERRDSTGGVWSFRANRHSHLQASRKFRLKAAMHGQYGTPMPSK